MASLQNTITNKKILMLAQHSFGRDHNSCTTLLTQLDASRIHATIFWNGDFWYLQDTSKNGTFINNTLISKGSPQRLKKGELINFGNNESDPWKILNVEAPQTMLAPLTTNSPYIPLEDIVALPNEKKPEIMLYPSDSGQWICESEEGIYTLEHNDKVKTQKEAWRFIDVGISKETQSIDKKCLIETNQIEAYFDVSQNEELVSLRLIVAHIEVDLGLRNHHYLLLLLARKRIIDREKNVIESEQGWIDKDLLIRDLGLSENHINIQIYRIRKQIMASLPNSFLVPQVIERRTREIRFTYKAINIRGGIVNVNIATETSGA
jgi:pSer/pThr/pTyr-binding forkhead associated (FHA) protein